MGKECVLTMKVIKRDGTIVEYNAEKIRTAIKKANNEVSKKQKATDEEIDEIIKYIEDLRKSRILVEDIQDIIEQKLMEIGRYELAKQYITYRYTRALVRKANTTDQTIKELIDGESEYWNNENANKNARVVTTQRDYLAGITSTDITRRFLLPDDVVKAHDEGIIHFHDADYFAQNALTNCELINLEDMLQNGTIMNGVMIEKPHRFITACTIATQIILAVTSSTYGGATVSLAHLAPFVRSSYEKYYKKYKENGLSKEQCEKFAKEDTKKEVADGVQTFNYQVNSMTNTNGQAPFLSVCMYLGETDEYKEELAMIIEEFLKQRYIGMKNPVGAYVTPAFPKLLYVLDDNNVPDDSQYRYLTDLAVKCVSKRMMPDFISAKIMRENYEGQVFPCMGCRSFLSPWKNEKGEYQWYGRFNQGVVTLNLTDVGLSANKNMDSFWKILDERLDLCYEALMLRHESLKGTPSDISPIHWQYGAIARLKPGEKIDSLLDTCYSTLSLGYIGLYECVVALIGQSHTTEEGDALALEIMQKLRNTCDKWKKDTGLGFALYGTPAESTTYTLARALKKRFGIVPGVTDKDYITNSYHVNVREHIDAFSKLGFEAKFQKISSGGAISYVEVTNMTNNFDAMKELINYMYETIQYAEINTKSDYCQECGFSGEILLDENNEWYCPNCGNRNHKTLNVCRRTCGYLGDNFWNKGRTQEIKERFVHLDNRVYQENN